MSSGEDGPLAVRERSPPLELCLVDVVVDREAPRVLARRRTVVRGFSVVLRADIVNRLLVLVRCLV